MNILVTGSNGFVGSRLMYELENKKHSVVGIDISDKCDSKKHPMTIIGDIRIESDIIRAVIRHKELTNSDVEVIIHCAAAKHDFGISETEYYSHNETGTKIITQFAEKYGIKKILYFSTVSVYGHPPIRANEDEEYNPDNPYGASKLAGELICKEWQQKDVNNELVVLRPTVIYGPYNYANMYKLIDMMHRHPYITIGNGNHIKSIVSLDNLVNITLFCLDKMRKGMIDYNCVDKPYMKLRELMELIAKNREFRIPLIRVPLSTALLLGKLFDVFAIVLKKDIPVNSDRLKKLSTATDFSSDKLTAEGYIQEYSTENCLNSFLSWYLDVNKVKTT